MGMDKIWCRENRGDLMIGSLCFPKAARKQDFPRAAMKARLKTQVKTRMSSP
jgi:hypothetical protein